MQVLGVKHHEGAQQAGQCGHHPHGVSSCSGGFMPGPQFLSTRNELYYKCASFQRKVASGPTQSCKVVFYSDWALSKAKLSQEPCQVWAADPTPAEGCIGSSIKAALRLHVPAKTNSLNAPTAGSTDGRIPTWTIWGFCTEVSDLQSPTLPIPGFFLWLEQLNPIFHSENWQLTLYQSTEM